MRQIQQDDKKSMWPQLFVTGLIVLGVGMTGASMIKRVQAIENYPRIVVDILQQSCDTSAFANPMENVRGETTKMLTYLSDQLSAMERFHMAQREIGIPPRRAVVILIGVPVQVILKVQERKRILSQRRILPTP